MKKPVKKSKDLLIVFFYIFIAVLIVFFVVITLKIALSPICTTDAQHVCVVDSMAIAGLTAAVFGIAATVLTFLGAFAVAYWWANLDTRVEVRTNELIEQRIQTQEASFQTQIQSNVKDFERQISQLEASLRGVRKEIIIATTLLPPWELEEWARNLLDNDPSSEIATRMVIRYLGVLNIFLPDPSEPSGPEVLYVFPSNDPLYYWNKALEWQQIVHKQNIPGYVDNANRKIEQRRPSIEEYKKQKEQETKKP